MILWSRQSAPAKDSAFDLSDRSSKIGPMTNEDEKRLHRRRFYKAEQGAEFVEAHVTSTAQTRDPTYRLAFRDTDFLLREEL